jgi:putative transposase
MARQWRIEYAGGIYHILSRGNQKQIIFKNNKDREQFIDILGIASIRFSIEIYAFVLMGNHYHILLKTKKANLSKAMQWIGSTYTRKFNIRHQQIGHLFQGRFKSILVENETYLLRLSYYIHRNPLRAGLVKRLADYQWSSYNAYAYKKSTFPNWLNIKFILSRFTSKDQHRSYRLKAQNYSDENKQIWEDVKHGLIFGSEQFIEKIKNKFLKKNKDLELPQHNQLKNDFDINQFIDQASKILNCRILEEKVSRHSPAIFKENRDLTVYYLKQYSELSNQIIGDKFSISYSAVSKIVTHTHADIKNSMTKQKKLKKLDSQFKV